MATVNRPRPSGTWGRRLRCERGQALIEMALTLPLLLLICTGIFEFGRAYQTWEVLTNAAREGARVAVLPGGGPGTVDARVREYLSMGGLDSDSSVQVDVNPTTVSMGAAGSTSASQVVVSYPFSFIVLKPIANLVGGNSLSTSMLLSASVTMRNEQ
jgi:hypothetical protein